MNKECLIYVRDDEYFPKHMRRKIPHPSDVGKLYADKINSAAVILCFVSFMGKSDADYYAVEKFR